METFSVFAANKMSEGLEEQCVYKSALFTCKSLVPSFMDPFLSSSKSTIL